MGSVNLGPGVFYLPNVATLGRAFDLLSGGGVSASRQTAFDSDALFGLAIGDQIQS
jgi:hypothetical protein